MNWQTHIDQRPEIMTGKPVITGTRITLEHLLERLSAGWKPSQLLAAYPHLKLEHIHAAIIHDITTAFDGVAREDGTTLHEGDGLDCWMSPEELLEERKRDTDTRWQDVPDDSIALFSSAFSYMNAKGLRYYLPAVMVWHLTHTPPPEGYLDSASADHIWSHLVKPDFPDRELPELFNMLTEAQRRATARWLYVYPLDAVKYAQQPWPGCLAGTIWEPYLRP
jgi:uncharacterized protein (DUF433 family)